MITPPSRLKAAPTGTKLSILSEYNCTAALTFNDAKAAEEDLAALRTAHGMVWARVFTRDGTLFAEYVRQNPEHQDLHASGGEATKPSVAGDLSQDFSLWQIFYEGHVDRSKFIAPDSDAIGTIRFRSDLKKFRGHGQTFLRSSPAARIASHAHRFPALGVVSTATRFFPVGACSVAGPTLVVWIFGEGPFGGAVEPLLGKAAGERQLTVKRGKRL